MGQPKVKMLLIVNTELLYSSKFNRIVNVYKFNKYHIGLRYPIALFSKLVTMLYKH